MSAQNEEPVESYVSLYNPADYTHLKPSSDERELFNQISEFKINKVELDTVLKCFIPEYIPAIGTPHNFVSVCESSSLLISTQWNFFCLIVVVVMLRIARK